MLELRTLWLPDAVSTPASVAMKADPFCVTTGSRLICSTSIVDVTDADCVCTSSVPARTSIVSDRVPSESVMFGRFAGVPATSFTSLMTAVLNPCSVTVTV